jgi:hypothetical protein
VLLSLVRRNSSCCHLIASVLLPGGCHSRTPSRKNQTLMQRDHSYGLKMYGLRWWRICQTARDGSSSMSMRQVCFCCLMLSQVQKLCRTTCILNFIWCLVQTNFLKLNCIFHAFYISCVITSGLNQNTKGPSVLYCKMKGSQIPHSSQRLTMIHNSVTAGVPVVYLFL